MVTSTRDSPQSASPRAKRAAWRKFAIRAGRGRVRGVRELTPGKELFVRSRPQKESRIQETLTDDTRDIYERHRWRHRHTPKQKWLVLSIATLRDEEVLIVANQKSGLASKRKPLQAPCTLGFARDAETWDTGGAVQSGAENWALLPKAQQKACSSCPAMIPSCRALLGSSPSGSHPGAVRGQVQQE